MACNTVWSKSAGMKVTLYAGLVCCGRRPIIRRIMTSAGPRTAIVPVKPCFRMADLADSFRNGTAWIQAGLGCRIAVLVSKSHIGSRNKLNVPLPVGFGRNPLLDEVFVYLIWPLVRGMAPAA